MDVVSVIIVTVTDIGDTMMMRKTLRLMEIFKTTPNNIVTTRTTSFSKQLQQQQRKQEQ